MDKKTGKKVEEYINLTLMNIREELITLNKHMEKLIDIQNKQNWNFGNILLELKKR